MISVFYDGKCGVCRREISYYIRIAPRDVFNWIDLTVDRATAEKTGISYVDLLRQMHASDEAGNLHVGVDAFILIWRHIPRWRFLAIVVANPLIRPLAKMAYGVFAAWRFNRLAHCQIELKKESKRPN